MALPTVRGAQARFLTLRLCTVFATDYGGGSLMKKIVSLFALLGLCLISSLAKATCPVMTFPSKTVLQERFFHATVTIDMMSEDEKDKLGRLNFDLSTTPSVFKTFQFVPTCQPFLSKSKRAVCLVPL